MDEKKALRRAMRERGELLTRAYREAADRAIRGHIQASGAWQRSASVFIYVSMWTEPDTRALLEEALKSGKTLYVPRCDPGRSMRAVRLASLDKLRPGTLGIPEPVGDRESAGPGDIELALIPCVTATRDGRRLGHGMGYYDRFLEQHRCRKLCLCYEALLSTELPTDAHDVLMDAVVTENGLYTR